MTPLQERMAAAGWRLDWTEPRPGGTPTPQLWALGLLIPTVEVKVGESDGVLQATVRMENGADVRVFYDSGESEGTEVWLHLMVNGHMAKADDQARVIGSCCPGQGPATEGHDAELMQVCGRMDEWAAIDGATPADLLRWLQRLSTYTVVR